MKSTGWIALVVVTAAVAFQGGRWAAQRDVGSPREDVPATASALREILELENAGKRASALSELLLRARADEAAELHAVLAADRLRVDELTEILFAEWWAGIDPAAAFEKRLDPPWERHPWLRTVVEIWTREDPLAATAAVTELSKEARVAATRVLLDTWLDATDHDPEPLFALIRTLEVKPRGRALERFLDGMIERRGADAAMAFAEAQPDDALELNGGVKNELMGRMGVVLARRDIELARRWAAKHGEGRGRQGFGVLLHLAFHWGGEDGPAAMDWAMQLPQSEFKHGVIARAFLSFQRTRREEAAAWLEARRPTSDLRQVFIPYLDKLIASEKTARALEIAWSAEDEATRDALLQSIGKNWLRRDWNAAERWLAESELPAGVEEAILEAAAAWRKAREARG